MDSISCLLLEVREEMKQNKSVNRAQKIAMLVSTDGNYSRNSFLASVSL